MQFVHKLVLTSLNNIISKLVLFATFAVTQTWSYVIFDLKLQRTPLCSSC